MNLLTLSIKLPRLFLLADQPASLLFGRLDLSLDLCPNVGEAAAVAFAFAASLRRMTLASHSLMRFAHKGRAVGFAHITAVHKQIDNGNIPRS